MLSHQLGNKFSGFKSCPEAIDIISSSFIFFFLPLDCLCLVWAGIDLALLIQCQLLRQYLKYLFIHWPQFRIISLGRFSLIALAKADIPHPMPPCDTWSHYLTLLSSLHSSMSEIIQVLIFFFNLSPPTGMISMRKGT